MQTSLAKKLTWRDIEEIVSVIETMEKEKPLEKNEDYYSEALLRICKKYKLYQACKERYKQLVPIAEEVTGETIGKERTFEHTILRCMIACRLKDEGYSLSDIAKAMKYNHATIIFYFKKKEDFLSLPLMFEREVRWFKAFDEALKNERD